MKKTVTVNISGIVFHIDEDAYEKLNKYLLRIKAYFRREEGGDEIITGIESRIAEMFQERRKDHSKAINIEDVNEAIAQLGEPSEMDEGQEDQKKHSGGTSSIGDDSTPRRLFRDPDNKYIGGVCSGLAAYFNIDPTWVRILFVVLILLAGSTIFAYIILWIVIPRARTTADRLSMRGEKINLSNIEKAIREDLQDIKKNLEDLSKKV